MNNTKNNHSSLVLLCVTGLFAAMITVMTAYVCHIPYGANGGYIHFGDALIYIAAIMLPRPYAIAAAAIGGGLADLLTAPAWAPATVIIKILITLPFTSKGDKILNPRNIAAPFIAFALSATGYYLATGIMFGSWISPLASLAGSAIQSGGSAVVYFAIAIAFAKANMKLRVNRLIYGDIGKRKGDA